MTDAIPKPDRPAKGQRWRYDGKDKAREFEVAEVIGQAPDRRVRLRGVNGGDSRVVEWSRLWLCAQYVYLGDFSVPEGYTICNVGASLGGHCFRDPFGFVSGPMQRGQRWTWQQARDAAVEHAKTNSPGRRKKG